MSDIPSDFDVDTDPFTEEDGRGDDVDRPLPDIDPDEWPEDEEDS